MDLQKSISRDRNTILIGSCLQPIKVNNFNNDDKKETVHPKNMILQVLQLNSWLSKLLLTMCDTFQKQHSVYIAIKAALNKPHSY